MATITLADAVVALRLDDSRYNQQISQLGKQFNQLSKVLSRAIVLPGLAVATLGIRKFMTSNTHLAAQFNRGTTQLKRSFDQLLFRIGQAVVKHWDLVRVMDTLKHVMDSISTRQIEVFLDVVKWAAVASIMAKMASSVMALIGWLGKTRGLLLGIAGAKAVAGAAGAAGTAVGTATGITMGHAIGAGGVAGGTMGAMRTAHEWTRNKVKWADIKMAGNRWYRTGRDAFRGQAMGVNWEAMKPINFGVNSPGSYSFGMPPVKNFALNVGQRAAGFAKAGGAATVLFAGFIGVWRGFWKALDLKGWADVVAKAKASIESIWDVLTRVMAAIGLFANAVDMLLIEPISNVINVLLRLQAVVASFLTDIITIIPSLINGKRGMELFDRTKEAGRKLGKGIMDMGYDNGNYGAIWEDMKKNWNTMLNGLPKPQNGNGRNEAILGGKFSTSSFEGLNQVFQGLDLYSIVKETAMKAEAQRTEQITEQKKTNVLLRELANNSIRNTSITQPYTISGGANSYSSGESYAETIYKDIKGRAPSMAVAR